MKILYTLLATVPLASAQDGANVPCESLLYCRGEVLRQIELARPFSDSKTYNNLYKEPLDPAVTGDQS